MEKQKILIIGGDSFVAQNFLKRYETIYDFSLISRKKTGFQNEIVIDNFFATENAHFKEIDIVFNCAAIVHQPDTVDENIYYKINTELAVLSATKAKQNGVKLFIQMSTIAVYGDLNEISINSPEKPTNAYGKSKLEADRLLWELKTDLFNVLIMRPPMIYGGGNAPGNMMRLIGLVDKGIPLPFRNATNKRDFININNLVQYINSAIIENKSGMLLLNDNQAISTLELVRIIKTKLGKRNFIFSFPTFFVNFLKKIKPDVISKLFDNLSIESNYKPRTPINFSKLENGIDEMVNWYKK